MDRKISANRADVVIKNIRDKKCTLSLMWLYLLIKIPPPRFPERLSKYKDLEIEITRTWQMKKGLVKKGSEKLMREIPGNINLWEIQKTALMGTAHILRKVLSIK